MSEYPIPRYKCCGCKDGCLPSAPDGEYVLYTDYARLSSENQRLREALEAADEGIQLAYKVPRPWINGGMSYEEWEKCCQKIDEVQAKVRAALAEKEQQTC